MMFSFELWGVGEVLVKIFDCVYMVNDYEEFFRDVGFLFGIMFRKMVKDLIYFLVVYVFYVRLYCLYGIGVYIFVSYLFGKGEFLDK